MCLCVRVCECVCVSLCLRVWEGLTFGSVAGAFEDIVDVQPVVLESRVRPRTVRRQRLYTPVCRDELSAKYNHSWRRICAKLQCETMFEGQMNSQVTMQTPEPGDTCAMPFRGSI